MRGTRQRQSEFKRGSALVTKLGTSQRKFAREKLCLRRGEPSRSTRLAPPRSFSAMSFFRPQSGFQTGRRPVWLVLIWVNVACFATQILVDSFLGPEWVEERFALGRDAVTRLHVWQFFTYMFLHANFVHLLLNMVTFYFAGREVERVVGPRHLWRIFLFGGLAGGVAQLALTWRHFEGVVGASAGVCAALIAFTTIYPEVKLTMLLFFVIPVRLKAKYLAFGLVAFSLVMAVTGAEGNIGHIAHLGGCVVGWLYARRLGYGSPLKMPDWSLFHRPRTGRRSDGGPDEFVSSEIDPILDKILREGMQSLTDEERRILERGRSQIEKRVNRR
jgi:membrane associated rhomboid family serine protease